MTNIIYRTGRVNTNPSTFGGIIYASDFETEYYPEHGRHIADRIASDWKFDKQCKKNELSRDKRKEWTKK